MLIKGFSNTTIAFAVYVIPTEGFGYIIIRYVPTNIKIEEEVIITIAKRYMTICVFAKTYICGRGLMT